MIGAKTTDFEHYARPAHTGLWPLPANGLKGEFQSKHGVVKVRVEPVGYEHSASGLVSMSISHGGIHHHRIWRRLWSEKTMANLAKRLAAYAASQSYERFEARIRELHEENRHLKAALRTIGNERHWGRRQIEQLVDETLGE